MTIDLSEFRLSARRVNLEPACEILGIDLEFYTGSQTAAFWLYADDCYLEELQDGTFFLQIGRDETIGTKEDLEAELYFEHYVSECVTGADQTIAFLTETLRAWATFRKLDLRSADEMLAECDQPKNRYWLEWFLRAWEDAERRAYGREYGNRA